VRAPHSHATTVHGDCKITVQFSRGFFFLNRVIAETRKVRSRITRDACTHLYVTAYRNAVTLQVTDTIRSYDLKIDFVPHGVTLFRDHYPMEFPVRYEGQKNHQRKEDERGGRWWRVTLHAQTCSGRNRIISLIRRPNTNSAPNMPVTLPRNQHFIRYMVTSPFRTVTIRRYGTRHGYECNRAVTGTGKTHFGIRKKKSKLDHTYICSMFAALCIVNVLVGTLKGNWTLVMRGLPLDNFRAILRKLYQQIKLTLSVCRATEGFRNQHTLPVQQHLYLSLVLFWKHVFIPRLHNSVFGMCINKLKFAISLGLHTSTIHLQPETFIIIFVVLGFKSSPVIGS
jgi:hypothetical protein